MVRWTSIEPLDRAIGLTHRAGPFAICKRPGAAASHPGREIMRFAGIDYWAVLIAAIAGYIVGAVWYWGLGKPWMAALGLTEAMIRGKDKKPSPLPFVLAFVADVVMAWVLAGLVG